jgi:DNA-binding XRE family transcriptional regulator
MMKHYTDKTIANATSEELLHALIKANGISDAARKSVRCTPHSESLIAIGPDATASIIVDTEDLSTLEDIVLPKPKIRETTPQQKMIVARHALGLTQAEIAAKANLSEGCISHYEIGRREPGLRNLAKLVVALGVTADHILGTEQMQPARIKVKA